MRIISLSVRRAIYLKRLINMISEVTFEKSVKMVKY